MENSTNGNNIHLTGKRSGDYKHRLFAIPECFKTAKTFGRYIFAIQDGGQCFTAKAVWEGGTAPEEKQHELYGESTDCKDDGKGGPLANQVYIFSRGIIYNKYKINSPEMLRNYLSTR